MEQNKKGNILKTIGFTLLVVVLFGIVLILIVRSEERWFAYVILAASAGSLVFFRRKSFWHGFRVFLSWIAAYTICTFAKGERSRLYQSGWRYSGCVQGCSGGGE